MAFLGLDTKQTLNTEQKEVFCALETIADIPLDDQSAWNMYPKYRWVYSTSRLLDLQNMPWSLYYSDQFSRDLNEFQGVTNKVTETITDGDTYPGIIFVDPNRVSGDFLSTDAVILKGELKWLAHHENKHEEIVDNQLAIGRRVLDNVHGEIELRVAAFAKMALPKYTGVISVDTIGSTIVGTRLRMTTDVISQYPADWMKNIIKLYNRKQWTM